MKNRPHAGLFIVLGLLMAIPVAFSAEPTHVSLAADAEDVQATGRAEIAGPFLGLRLRDQAGSDLQGFRLELDAQRLRVETDYEHYEYAGPMVVVPGEHRTSFNNFTHARVRGDVPAPGFKAWLVPSPEASDGPKLTVDAAGARLLPPSMESLTIPREATGGPRVPPEQALRSGLELRTAGGFDRLALTGSFVLSLNHWNVTVQEAGYGTSHAYPSGYSSTTFVADPTGRTGGVEQDVYYRQTYLFVENGSLRLTQAPAADFQAFVGSAALDLSGMLTLRSASGNLQLPGVSGELHAQRAELTGELQATLTPFGKDRVRADAQGTVFRATTDGQTLLLAAPTSSSSGPFSWALLGGLGLACAIPLGTGGALRARRALNDRSLRNAELLLRLGDDHGVLKATRRLLGSRHHRTDAVALRVEALLRLQRSDEARNLLDSTRPWLGPQAATFEYLRAYVAAHQNVPEEAVTYLQHCLQIAPELGYEVARQPVFAGVREDARLRPMLLAKPGRTGLLAGYE